MWLVAVFLCQLAWKVLSVLFGGVGWREGTVVPWGRKGSRWSPEGVRLSEATTVPWGPNGFGFDARRQRAPSTFDYPMGAVVFHIT